MTTKQPSFEENLTTLEEIVAQLEKGDVPLEAALTQFQRGVALSQQLQAQLENAEKTLTKVMSDSGEEQAFNGPDKETTDDTNTDTQSI